MGVKSSIRTTTIQPNAVKLTKYSLFIEKSKKIAFAKISFVFLRISFVFQGTQEGELPIELEV
jgi:hypothetical protein